MKHFYHAMLATVLSLVSWQAQAQYIFTDNTLGPYRQNFNTLNDNVSMAAEAAGQASRITMLPEVYAQANLNTEAAPYPFSPSTVPANDGTNGLANYYHFGVEGAAASTDRSFGGVASFDYKSGTGYVGIRLKNGSTKPITNLEIQYAMEQWYNSGRQDEAKVAVSYKTGTGLKNLLGAVGANSWKSISALDVDAPSTATVLAKRDGNAASNRRVRQTTLVGLNLAPGQEIMIRWAYALNDATNGNGLSIDDVVITPQTNIYYSSATGELNLTESWGTNADGTGTHPADFTAANTAYYVRGGSTSSRIRGNAAYPATDTWTISGTNSKIIVGDPTGTTAATLFLDDNDDVNATIDLLAKATLQVKRPTYSFTLGTLDHTSLVEYMATNSTVRILPAQYGQLKVTNTTEKTLAGNVLVTNSLNIGSKILLGDYTLTLQKGATITGMSASNYVVTNGKGTLRQSVPNSGADVVYPVGATTSSYTPMWLQQPSSTTARNEDVYGVRVLDNMYAKYDASGNGTTAVQNQNVKKTWLVDEEVEGNSDVTMTLQWNTADEATSSPAFNRSNSYISHYSSGAFDNPATTNATAGSVNNSYKISRPGITSFSPFVVSSSPVRVLPVELTAFGAQRTGQAVTAAWTTASEKNNDYFLVERSLDGQQFVAVGRVAGAGTSATSRRYTFLDREAPTALAYYRLRQVDLDGTTAYSPVVAVAALPGLAGSWAVVPNPGSTRFQLLSPAEATLFSGEVYNSVGARVATLQPTAGLSATDFDLSHQPSGMYLLRLRTSQGAATVRVVKQ